MIKLIASDLDGTLLLNHAQSLNPGTAELIHELTKQGRIFAAATCACPCAACGHFAAAVCQSAATADK